MLLSCKKDKLEGDKSVLIGKWEWDYTYNNHDWSKELPQGIKDTLTPINTNTNYSIEFLEEGKIVFYKNDAVVKEKRIVFNYFKLSVSGNYNVSLYLDNDDTDEFFFVLDENIIYNYQFPYVDEPLNINTNYFIKQ